MNDNKLKILFADDDPDFCFAVKEFFDNSKYDIDIVQNGVVALDKALNNKYAFIILDINMPFMKGTDAAQDIKRQRPEIPIAAVTGIYQEDDKMKLKEFGFDDVFIKPVKFQTIIDTIDRMLNKSDEKIEAPPAQTELKSETIAPPPVMPISPEPQEEEVSFHVPEEKADVFEIIDEEEEQSEELEEDPMLFSFAHLQTQSQQQLIMMIQKQYTEKKSLIEKIKELEASLKNKNQ